MNETQPSRSQQQVVLLRWQYSRNQLRHWVSDGELYRGGKPHPEGCELFEIRTNRPASTVRRPTDQYRLIHKGKIVDMHRVVKVLKATAEHIATKQQNNKVSDAPDSAAPNRRQSDE